MSTLILLYMLFGLGASLSAQSAHWTMMAFVYIYTTLTALRNIDTQELNNLLWLCLHLWDIASSRSSTPLCRRHHQYAHALSGSSVRYVSRICPPFSSVVSRFRWGNGLPRSRLCGCILALLYVYECIFCGVPPVLSVDLLSCCPAPPFSTDKRDSFSVSAST